MNKKITKQFPLVAGVSAYVDMQTGKETIVIPDITDKKMGVTISHIIKQGIDDDFKCGDGTRLNLHETLIKNEDGYIYTDSIGETHTVTENFYFVDENGAKQVVNDKESIELDTKGGMVSFYGNKPRAVYREQKTDNGLIVVTKLECLNGVQYIEQRTKEIKEVEEKIDSYEQAIFSFKRYNVENNVISEIKNSFPNLDNVTDLILTESEIISYKALMAQKTSVENSISKYLPVSKESLILQRNSLTSGEVYFDDKYDNYTDQINNINTQDAEADEQLILLNAQLQLLVEKSEQYRTQLAKYYVEYVTLLNELEKLKFQVPINFIICEDGIKGFNANGNLVVTYISDKKFIAIEYEYDNLKVFTRISRVYDENEREIKFLYSKSSSMLSEIRNSYGESVKLGYYLNQDWSVYILNQVVFNNGKTLDVERARLTCENDFSNIVRNDEYKVTKVENRTNISKTSYDNMDIVPTSNLINEYSIVYDELATTVIDDLLNESVYKFNETHQVVEYIEIKKDLVKSAIKYEYIGDLLTKVIYPKQSCLCVAKNNFSFVEDYSKTITYDDFEKITSETIGWIAISDAIKKQAVITYSYDENDQLKKCYTSITTKKLGTILSTKENIVQLFEYNKKGQLLSKKSYKEGKELIEGITIEEHVYDSNGFEIKTISYNSLDPSSKYYEEQEFDENGQVKSKLDQSGMFKTIFEGTTVIQPNGARLSYGYSVKDGNSAITMSTEDGEENSTQTLYTNGLITKVISGDNVYEYTYDFKGRVKKIQINGEEHVSYDYSKEGLIETTTATFADGHSEIYQESPEMQSKEIRGENVNVSQKITKALSGGKVTSITQQENGVNVNVTEYSYNKNNGRLIAERFYEYLDDGSKNEVYSQTYNYNDDGQLSCETINSTTNPRAMYNQYAYDENGKLVSYQYENDIINISPKTDCLGRNRGKSFSTINGKIYSEDITYLKQGDHATALPLTISYGRKIGGDFVVKENIKYKYDNMGNITKVYENGELVTEYKYDALNRLVRENNKTLNKTCVFLYDNKGNIIKKKEYPFTIKCDEYLELDLATDTIEYTYSNDKLIAFGDKTITYDESGKLLNYKDNEISWSFGNRLTSYGDNTFSYDAQGRRVSKNDIVYEYNTQNQIFRQSNGIKYFYDNDSSLYSFSYNDAMYFYKKDLLGNVIELLDTTGRTVVKYVYDAWGNHTITDNSGFGLGDINPFRYRGYYYDVETGLYFLKSRYYDPQTGRFISMDDISYLDPKTIGGANLYAYCLNNPIKYVDPNGNLAVGIAVVFATTIISAIVGSVVQGGMSAYKTGNNVWQGIGKGLVNGLVIGGSIVLIACGISVGWNTLLGSSMIIGGSSITLDIIEVKTIQRKKSISKGKNVYEINNDVANAIYANLPTIIFGKTKYGDINFYGTSAHSYIWDFWGFLVEVNQMSQYWKYSKAWSIVWNDYWLKSSKFGFISYFSLIPSVIETLKTILFEPDYENSDWILY